jgi:hypothetical protein
LINRAALILRPRSPFIEWARGIGNCDIVPSADDEQTVYLIPEHDTPQEFEKILKKVWVDIFENQLAGWYLDEAVWPKKRTLAMFRAWFQIECHTVIEDLCGYPLEDDELELE